MQQTKSDQNPTDPIITMESSIIPSGLWLLTGVILSALVVTFYYLSKQPASNNGPLHTYSPNQSEMTASKRSYSAEPSGVILPPLNKETTSSDPSSTSPKFTFYQELSDPPAEKLMETNDPSPNLTTNHHNVDASPTLELDNEASNRTASLATPLQSEEVRAAVISSNVNQDNSEMAADKTIKQKQSITKVDDIPKAYILQTGSFKDQLQADRQRAKLLLQGYDASIKAVTLTNGAVWHRVVMGPFGKSKAVELQAQLAEQSITAQMRANN